MQERPSTSLEEAARYLDAALIEKGECLPCLADVHELPEPDAEAEAGTSAEAADVEAGPPADRWPVVRVPHAALGDLASTTAHPPVRPVVWRTP